MHKILEIKDLKVHFALKGGLWSKPKVVHAVDGVSFDVYAGEILGIVGESGSGKSSLARAIVGLNSITSGDMVFNGTTRLSNLEDTAWHGLRKQMQFIFQDPIAALNPRMTVAEIIGEPLQIHFPQLSRAQVLERVVAMMRLVGLNYNQLNQYPTEFSGGQCQRISIARALILEPKLLICDEAVSALDASVKAQIINLLKDLQRQLNLTIIFISHDLSIIKHISDRVLIMYLGKIMELATKDTLYNTCHHPYTQALLAAVPIPDPRLQQHIIKLVDGDLPSPITPPLGCVFSTRCPKADNECRASRPQLRTMVDGAVVACFKA